MYHNQMSSIKTYIHPKTQALLRIQLIALVQKWTQSAFMTRITILTIWKIPIKILTLLIHKKKTWNILRLNKTNSMKKQMMTLSLKNNSNIVVRAQLDGVSNYHVFTNIKMFAYIRPLQCNLKILNGSKSPEKCFGLVIIKIPKKNIIIPLWPSYYMPQNPQIAISQTALKRYSGFRNVRTESLIWVQINTDTGIKFKV